MFAKSRLVLVALLIGTLLLVGGCSSKSGTGKAEPTPTPIPPPPVPEKPTYTVKRGAVVDSLSFTGRVSPSKEQQLFFRETGRVKKVYVERNAMVISGTLLAELENDDLQRQLTQAGLDLETVQMALQTAIETKNYQVARAKIDLEVKKLQLTRMQVGQADDTDVKIARSNMQKSQAALKLSQARYDIRGARGGAESSPEALDLESKTLDFEVAQANYERAVAKTGQTAALTVVDIEIQKQQIALTQLDLERQNKVLDPQLQKNVERSQLAVDRLKAKLDATRILAPIPGKVTSVSAYDGRAIEAYKVAVIVADESQLEITAEPLSSQMQKLTENMATSIALSAYPGKELVGKITKLPYPYGTGGSATQSTTEQDKLTHIAFDAGNLKVEPGDLVKVIVTLQQKQDALWLPPAALRTFAGRKFVVVEEEGRQRRVDVTTGIESAERVEILDGLKENQVVVGQ